MPMARCRRMSIGSNSPQTVLSPKNCYRRSTSSNTQSVAKKKGKTLAVTWLLSRWSRTWKQKVQILSSQDSAVVAPPFHRAEILTCHFLFLLHPCYSSAFMSNTLKNYCVCLIIHIFFLAMSLFTEANPEIPHFSGASPGFALDFFYCSSSRNTFCFWHFWLIYNEAASILPVVTQSTSDSVFTPRLYYFWTRCSVRLEH